MIYDDIIYNIISKFLIIQYYNNDFNYIKYIYNYIKCNLYEKHMLYFCKKIIILSHGYNNNNNLYYCYGYENKLLEWCFNNKDDKYDKYDKYNKDNIIKYIMINL